MGADLFFSFREMVGNSKPSPNGASFANLTVVNASDLTMIILESQLHIVVSDQYNSSQIMCSNIASGRDVTLNFNVGKKLKLTIIARGHGKAFIMKCYTVEVHASARANS